MPGDPAVAVRLVADDELPTVTKLVGRQMLGPINDEVKKFLEDVSSETALMRNILDDVLDKVRDRFGSASVARAAQLGRDPGWSTPVLPEHE